jgi:hypothetical protein
VIDNVFIEPSLEALLVTFTDRTDDVLVDMSIVVRGHASTSLVDDGLHHVRSSEATYP